MSKGGQRYCHAIKCFGPRAFNNFLSLAGTTTNIIVYVFSGKYYIAKLKSKLTDVLWVGQSGLVEIVEILTTGVILRPRERIPGFNLVSETIAMKMKNSFYVGASS